MTEWDIDDFVGRLVAGLDKVSDKGGFTVSGSSCDGSEPSCLEKGFEFVKAFPALVIKIWLGWGSDKGGMC